MQDATINCAACGGSFLFTASEQGYYAERGFQFPKRCRPCRQTRRRSRNAGPSGISGALPSVRAFQPRETFEANCVGCGDDMRIPFRLQGPPRCPTCFIEEHVG